MAKKNFLDFVTVDVRSPKAVDRLRPNRSRRTRIIALLPWRASGGALSDDWRGAVAKAYADPSVSIAIAPRSTTPRSLAAFLSLVSSSGKAVVQAVPGADATPPTEPGSLRVTGSGTDWISIAWAAASDNTAVTGYNLYLSGRHVGTTAATQHTFFGLSCGAVYRIEVSALDGAGHSSARSAVDASSLASCPGGGGGTGGTGGGGGSPPIDALPPTPPFGVAVVGSAPTSITLSWAASSDNVGVTGYGVYRNGELAGSTASTSYVVTGLACGSSYTLAVDAYDAAGNRSSLASASASTSGCSAPPDTIPPSIPPGLVLTASTQTSITVLWSASTDNVGVTGYGLYLNGASVGQTTSTSNTFGGLACGTGYTLGVDATDAAANRSGITSVSATTAACGGAALANLWVDTSGGTCSRSAIPVAYSDPAACSSLATAYNAASAGDMIYVKGGTYGAVTLPARALGSNVVRLSAAPGETPTFTGTVAVHASYVHLDGFTVTSPTGFVIGTNPGCSAYPCSFPTRNVTVTNFSVQTLTVMADTVLLQHGNVGPHDVCTQGGNEDGIVVAGLGSGPGPTWTPSNNVTVDDVTVHDIRNSGCGNHVDGIQLFSWHNFTLRNSRIYNTDSSLVLGYSFDESNPDQLRGMLIENNYFGSVPHPGHGVTLGAASQTCGSYANVVIQNNTFFGGVAADMTCGPANPVGIFRNNIVHANIWCGSSNTRFAWDYNVFVNPGSGCALTAQARVCTPAYADPTHAGGNADLTASDTCARNSVGSTAGTYPATDIRGTPRPQGSAPDIGAHESG